MSEKEKVTVMVKEMETAKAEPESVSLRFGRNQKAEGSTQKPEGRRKAR